MLREEASKPEVNLEHTLLLLLKSEVYATIALAKLCFYRACSGVCVESSLDLHRHML